MGFSVYDIPRSMYDFMGMINLTIMTLQFYPKCLLHCKTLTDTAESAQAHVSEI